MAATTRSQTTKSKTNGGAHDATRNPPGHHPDTNAAVNRDEARASAAHRTYARSKGTKGCRALKPTISEEDRHKRANSKATVSNTEANPKHRGLNPTRATGPRVTSRALAANKGRGSKPKTKGVVPKGDRPNPRPIRTPTTLSSQSLPTASDDERQGRRHAGASSKRGMKRKRDGEGTSEVDVSAARTRRRVDLPTDSKRRREDTMNPASRMDAPVTSNQGPRRSARLASRTSVPNRSLMEEAGHPMIGTQSQCTRQRVREDDENEEADAQRTRRHTSEPLVKQEDVAETGPATRIEPSERARDSAEVCDDSSLFLVKKEEEIDQTRLLTANASRHLSEDSDTSTPFLDREGTAFRSPSVESAAIMTPPPRTGLGTVRIYQDDEAWVPLGTIAEEAEEGEAHEVSLPQLDGSSDDEADEDDVENIFGADDERRRSLAPEPDEGLLAEIRSGRIPGLASPEG